MRGVAAALVVCLGLSLVGCGGGTKKSPPASPKGPTAPATHDTTSASSNAEKIVGRWEVVKSSEGLKGTIIEFTKDGKMIASVDFKGTPKTMEGTYKVKGDKLFSGPKGGPEEAATIDTLDETTLIIIDDKGKKDELKRKK
jgi:uncharacterized protein (TIGR03066 family)